VKFPLFSFSRDEMSIKIILLYGLYYAIISYIVSSIYSLNDPEYVFGFSSLDFYLIIMSIIMCLIITIFSLTISSFVTDSLKIRSKYYMIVSLMGASTINSAIYLFFDYFVWSSADYPLDLFRALRIASPFYLATFACMIL
jgi:hypothetical protein